ncbi:hypothetical protein PFMG_02590 [Plasmodium falciparum IGH-CR14]|uniref:Uncharacterized protein n=1 Tax=Plasmodium falciparum IGH-CR14 TaxID=580059 RepID=A0A0L1IA05_PLAFA|nr:hypothetical protein PFMG_02590 [Plasmodium falciparum IGH-CR14]
MEDLESKAIENIHENLKKCIDRKIPKNTNENEEESSKDMFFIYNSLKEYIEQLKHTNNFIQKENDYLRKKNEELLKEFNEKNLINGNSNKSQKYGTYINEINQLNNENEFIKYKFQNMLRKNISLERSNVELNNQLLNKDNISQYLKSQSRIHNNKYIKDIRKKQSKSNKSLENIKGYNNVIKMDTTTTTTTNNNNNNNNNTDENIRDSIKLSENIKGINNKITNKNIHTYENINTYENIHTYENNNECQNIHIKHNNVTNIQSFNFNEKFKSICTCSMLLHDILNILNQNIKYDEPGIFQKSLKNIKIEKDELIMQNKLLKEKILQIETFILRDPFLVEKLCPIHENINNNFLLKDKNKLYQNNKNISLYRNLCYLENKNFNLRKELFHYKQKILFYKTYVNDMRDKIKT